MLVVTRKKRESITIQCGEKLIRVVVTRVERGSAKLGIIADAEVKVARTELIDEPLREARHGVVEM
jgi:carbon storage regulator CsrA